MAEVANGTMAAFSASASGAPQMDPPEAAPVTINNKTSKKTKNRKTKKDKEKKNHQVVSQEGVPLVVEGNPTSNSPTTPASASTRIGMDGSVTPSNSSLSGGSFEGEKPVNLIQDKEASLPASNYKDEFSTSDTDVIPRRRCGSSRWFLAVICLMVVATAVVVPLLLLGGDDTPNDGILRLSSAKATETVADISLDLCHGGVPGYKQEGKNCQGPSGQGGALCNLVAKGMMMVTDSDIAILPSGACLSDLTAPSFTVNDLKGALASDELVLIETSGSRVIEALEGALAESFGSAGNLIAYPFAAGLRYDVAANLDFGERLVSPEINVEQMGIWRPINPRRFYRIITTIEVANGNLGYSSFADVIEQWKTPLSFNAGDAFYTYIKETEDEEWSELPTTEYSTQVFVGPLVEPTLATVVSPISSKSLGEGACNLVAWSLLDQTFQANIALFRSSYCADDLSEGVFNNSALTALLPVDHRLALVSVIGSEIVSVLNNAVDAAIDDGREESYPFAAGLRFVVDSNASVGSRVSSVEVMDRSSRWATISSSKTYIVLTSEDLVTGGDSAYSELSSDADLRFTSNPTRKTFLNYADDWALLYDPPPEKYSTQRFIQ